MSSRKPYMMISSLIVLFFMASFFSFVESPPIDNETENQTIPSLSGGYTSESDFTFENGVLTKYIGTDEIVNIPSTINGEAVIKIGHHAFYREGIKSITIPDSVTTFNVFAFYDCKSLESIIIPDSVTTIQSNAFGLCSSLENVVFGSGIKYIDSGVFAQCASLTDVTIPDHITSIGNNAFSGCTSLKSFTAGTGLKTIGDNAFKGCSLLESITMHGNLEKIGKSVFDECTSLESIVIPDSVTSIGNDIFKNCSSLKYVTLGSNVTEIGNFAFYQCASLESIVIPDSVTSIGNYAFKKCPIKTIVIPDSVTSISGYAFEECLSLESVTLGNNLKTIGMKAFNYCSSLDSVIIPEGVTSIESGAFNCCFSLKSVVIPDSVTTLGSSAFNYCSSLESVSIGNGVATLDSYAFGLCTSLKNITIPDSVTSINSNAFSSCTSLESVVIPDGITKINSSTFLNCTSLKSVVIPDSVTGIGSTAFKGCSSLESVIIPAGVTYIHAHAFGECPSLKTVILLGEDVSGFLSEFCSYVVYMEGRTVYMRDSVAGEDYAGNWGTDIVKTFHSSGIERNPDFIVELEDSDNVRLYWYPSPYKIMADVEDVTDEYLKFSVYYRETGSSEWISYYGDFVPFTGYSGAESILLRDIPSGELCEFKVIFYDGFVERAFESNSLDNMSKITWEIDGSDDVVRWVPKGDVPTYADTPVKESTLFNDYTFIGWTPSVSEAAGNVKYTAVFDETVRKYTVTFVPGSGEDDIVIIQEYNTGLIEPENPVREGYSFKGWNPNVPLTIPAEDLCFYAAWDVNLYTVTWSINGSEFDVDIEYGSSVNIPRFTEKEGHTFTGWNIDIPEYMPANDLFIEASWTVNIYSIKWVVDGTQHTDSYEYGSEVICVENPVKEGYSFMGWGISVPDTMPAKDLTLTASWSINTYGIIWIIDDLIIEHEYEYGDEVIPVEDPSKDGHTFLAWDIDVPDVMSAEDLMIKATWSVNSYCFTWVTDESEIEQEYLYGTETVIIEDPIKEGYTFDGWDTPIPSTMPAENVTVRSLWSINTYTISWNIDGTIFEVEVTYNSEIIIPKVIQKEGYEFLGWNLDVPDIMPANDLTITAKWSANPYSVTWIIDDVQIIEEYAFGTEIAPIENPVKEGYTFKGWDKNVSITMPSEDLVITALWNINEYTITLVLGNGEDKITLIRVYNDDVTEPNDPVRKGYTFIGWDTVIPSIMPADNLIISAEWSVNTYELVWIIDDTRIEDSYDYEAEIIIMDAPVKEGYTFIGWDAVIPSTMPAENMTLTAKWSADVYGLSWIIDGTVIEQEYGYGAEILMMDNPNKEGYTFDGWDTVIPPTMPAGDLTVSAEWSINTYTLTWVIDDVRIEDSYDYGAEITIIDALVKEGYTFIGWDTVIPSTMPAENLTIAAKWSINTYTVTWIAENNRVVTEHKYRSELSSLYPPMKDGYSFSGWNQPLPDTMPAYDLTVTALWTINTYSLFWVIGDLTIEEKYEYGSEISLVEKPLKEGHTFVKWNRIIPEFMPSENVMIIAEFSVNTYSVTWIIDDSVIECGYDCNSVISKIDNPVKEGYSFAGWSQNIPETMPAKNLTFFAKWNVDRYILTLDLGDSSIDLDINYGSEIDIDGMPERQGYTFVGWDKEIPAYMPAENFTVSAVWELKTYSISWIVDGDLLTVTEVEYGKIPFGPFDEPVKESDGHQSYQFEGWLPKIVPVTGNTEYHAVFTGIPNTYTVTFDTNGGTGDVPFPSQLGYGTLLRLSLVNGIQKDGYNLEGWSTTLSGSVIDELEVKSDVTVYAIWNTVSSQGDTQSELPLTVSAVAVSAITALIVGLVIGRTRLSEKGR